MLLCCTAAPDGSLLYVEGNSIRRAFMEKSVFTPGQQGQPPVWTMKWKDELLAGKSNTPGKFEAMTEVCSCCVLNMCERDTCVYRLRNQCSTNPKAC